MSHLPRRRTFCALLLPIALAACSSGSGSAKNNGNPPVVVDGKSVSVGLGADQKNEIARLQSVRTADANITADELIARHAPTFTQTLGYDPKTAEDFDLLQASTLKLDANELQRFGTDGFVISARKSYPHFAYGYATIYSQDLPVYVTADSILEAVHKSYDSILLSLENAVLSPELAKLLEAAHTRLPTAPGIDATTRTDVDLFLTVAESLLSGTTRMPIAGASAEQVTKLVSLANKAEGTADLDLFGATRTVDFSQFTPRGHYKGIPELERYLRAMMWLGRLDFPMLQTDPDTGKPVFIRRSVAAAFALRGVMNDADIARYRMIDETIRAFVGEPDSMTPLDVDRLKQDLGLSSWDISGVADDALAAAIVRGAYGAQKILSQVVIQAPHQGAFPLDASFLFLGQRYVVDSHVFSNVVYDRVGSRMMPDPLDVAFAALGNGQAAKLLESDLRKNKYAPALAGMRALVDAHGSDFWNANLYNIWLSSLRALSPSADLASESSGLPKVAKTEAWGRRMLSGQLASWAELRHDTILYTKQSYTTGVACMYPDAYVEPYPAFFAQIEAFAKKGGAIAEALPFTGAATELGQRVKTYFEALASVSATLRAMAENQRAGKPHTKEQLAFINRQVRIQTAICGSPPQFDGWYKDLFFSATGAEFAPTIADVHTQPTDAAGTPVGKVLHVGTGNPRLIVATFDTCNGPRAYAGVVSAYHELVTEGFDRFDDSRWIDQFRRNPPTDVPWMKDLVVAP